MAKFFSANKSFVDYITMLGFKHTEVKSQKKYYVNEKGNQIKIDYETRIITFLDKSGYNVDFSTNFTNEQIDKFSIREDIFDILNMFNNQKHNTE